ncbi:MAG: DUF5050 domain-containing protein, partial [Clostridiales bacterium]|nr:DUF5050 domain-containing protein [Clostridiales bacterium]
SLYGTQNSSKDSGREIPIHPENIVIDARGDIKTEGTAHQLLSYLPLETGQIAVTPPGMKVYALGMLMLYMATGKETKAELDITHISRSLRYLIQRCTAFDPEERFKDTKELLKAVKHETGLGKKTLSILSVLLPVFLMVALLIYFGREGLLQGGAAGEKIGYRSGFADGFKRGFSDAPGIGLRATSFDAHSGNLSGNFIPEEDPFAVLTEDTVFFLSGDNLCRMEPYTQEIEIITAVPGADTLQYHDGWLYYRKSENIFRMNPKTEKEEVVCESLGGQFYIFDDVIYLYDSAGTDYLYSIDPDKGTMTQLNGATAYCCLNVVGRQLYYISPDNGNCICRSDLDGSNLSLISSGSYESLCIYDGSIYAAIEDGLIRMDLNGGNPVILASRALYFPNVSDSGIFCISGQEKTLEWMSLDGKTRYTVVATKTSSFNIAGQRIFYRNEEDAGSLWRIHISGTHNVKITE